MAWSEARLHAHLAGWPRPRILTGSRLSDAAVLAKLGGRPVVCSDQVIEGVHLLPAATPAQIGWKAAARALSDLAASAARPLALELCLRAPPERSERWMIAVLEAVRRAASVHGAELVGGDLAQAPGPFGLAVTALGVFPGRGRPPGRDRAQVGQKVLLTGAVGGSLLGRHLRIRPRLAAGAALHAAGARAMMDVSDGLALDLLRLAQASGVGIELERVPIHRDARRLAQRSLKTALQHALEDGEDHELIATLAPSSARRLLEIGLPGCPGLVEIGRVVSRPGLWLRLGPGREPEAYRGPGGYLHGVQPEAPGRPGGSGARA